MATPRTFAGLTVYINGRLLPIEEAHVSVLDRGFLYGDGCYETLNVVDGTPFRLDDHLNRFYSSASVLDIPVPLDRERLSRAVTDTVNANSLRDAYVRILLSRGESFPIIDIRAATGPSTLVILVHPRQRPAEVAGSFRQDGLHARIVTIAKISPNALDPHVKSLNYLNSILARSQAVDAGADEAILLDVAGFVAEGAGSNLFALHGSTLTTPRATSILVGITRSVVIALASEAGLTITEENMTPHHLYTADEVFLTSTYGGIIPITRIDGRFVGPTGPNPGPTTLELKTAYDKLLVTAPGV